MADGMTDVVVALTALILVVLLVVLGYLLWRGVRRQRKLVAKYGYVPSGVELYFEEYFESIVRNWDILTRSKAESWSADMGKRLDAVGKDVGKLGAFSKGLNARLDNLERLVDRLEKA